MAIPGSGADEPVLTVLALRLDPYSATTRQVLIIGGRATLQFLHLAGLLVGLALDIHQHPVLITDIARTHSQLQGLASVTDILDEKLLVFDHGVSVGMMLNTGEASLQ